MKKDLLWPSYIGQSKSFSLSSQITRFEKSRNKNDSFDN